MNWFEFVKNCCDLVFVTVVTIRLRWFFVVVIDSVAVVRVWKRENLLEFDDDVASLEW
jgi:hypothetical protein